MERPVKHDAMTRFSLREAAKQVGKGTTTIFRAIKSGRLSASRTDGGGYAIDAAELFRVYPPVKSSVPAERSMEQIEEQAAAAHGMALRMAEMEIELRMTRMMLDDIKADRDHWRDMAESAQRLLTDQRAKPRPISTGAPRPPAAPPEPRSGDVIETSIQSGMAEIRRHLENLRAKGGH